MSSHHLFIDDSGTKEYGAAYSASNTRHFVFGGVLLTNAEAGLLSEAIKLLKGRFFGRPDVEIKSNWLRMPKECEQHYLKPYRITEESLREFVEGFYGLVNEANLVLLASVVDKVHMQEDYPKNPWYPPALAYELLLQRAQSELGGTESQFTVTMDDMSGKTPKGTKYQKNLLRQHEALRRTGSRLKPGFPFPNLEGGAHFKASDQSDILQVADLAAYNVFRQFKEHGEEWETAGITELPTYPYFTRIVGKFRKGFDGRIQGYGVVKMPLRKRVRWSVRDKKDAAP